jgi:hypothetical protein
MPIDTNAVISAHKAAFLTTLDQHYNQKNFSNFVSYSQDISSNTGNLWEIQIAISALDPENLYNAANAIAIALPDDVAFKCWIRSRKGASFLPDGTCITQEQVEFSDSDQRTKAISLSIAFDAKTQRFKKTPAECKDLILKCWQALIENKVEFGYAHSTKVISAAPGIHTPFSITPLLPYGRHRIANELADYYSTQLSHPLGKMLITYDDLTKYKIPITTIKTFLEKKNAYLTEHWLENSALWRDRFIEIANEVSTFSLPKVIERLQALLEEKPPLSQDTIVTITGFIEILLLISPYDIGNNQTPAPFKEIVELNKRCKKLLPKANDDQLKSIKTLLNTCSEKIMAECCLLMGEFINNSHCCKEIRQLATASKLNTMFLTRPRDMYMLYVNALCLEKEFQGINIEKANLNSHLQEYNQELAAKKSARHLGASIHRYNGKLPQHAHVQVVRTQLIDATGKALAVKDIRVTPEMYQILRHIIAAEYTFNSWTDTLAHIQQIGASFVHKTAPAGRLSMVLSYGLSTHASSLIEAAAHTEDRRNQKKSRLCGALFGY